MRLDATDILFGPVNAKDVIPESVDVFSMESFASVGEKSDIWGGADVTSFKNDLMSETGKKLAEFLKKSR